MLLLFFFLFKHFTRVLPSTSDWPADGGMQRPFLSWENNQKKKKMFHPPAAIHLHERSLYFRCAHYVSDLSHTFNWWHAFRRDSLGPLSAKFVLCRITIATTTVQWSSVGKTTIQLELYFQKFILRSCTTNQRVFEATELKSNTLPFNN